MSDKTRKAIGLRYGSSDKKTAPKIVSKGYGDLAEAIIHSAQEAGILIHEDPYLSDMLATLDLGQEIPEALYYIIAELIAYSYMLQGKTPQGWEDSGHLPQKV
ncbi:EscU/YscU/HrcU family type III secretion system export apparatus switch protein [Aestuariibacter sp. A3R04]|uniref:EscU/YscU/HrcU family type III secretion system export apparatus switch protein n=1 Tax=Aestuariibacter sp. A3R04 TaxID=2841571 RepID=UPI001C08890C|nr:EscU/YscU/HrcU family type III secretion system export apparatus switch protein [Aestuariibacter sp. A3R04]MBU3022077.1 EscU/YscU/HrcU family type III secretion system export apparatus switch protein [Aestuariibacter sp. A3R04]